MVEKSISALTVRPTPRSPSLLSKVVPSITVGGGEEDLKAVAAELLAYNLPGVVRG